MAIVFARCTASPANTLDCRHRKPDTESVGMAFGSNIVKIPCRQTADHCRRLPCQVFRRFQILNSSS